MKNQSRISKELHFTKFLAASLGLAVTGLATQSALAADSAWTGSIDQDFFNEFNWSAGLPNTGFDTGTINEAAVDFFPIINGSIDFGTNVDFQIGAGPLFEGLLEQTSGDITSTGWTFVGRDGGTGTFNQNGGSFSMDRVFVGAGGDSTGTFNQTGGTLNVTQFWQGNGDGTISGTSNISGTVNVGEFTFVSHADNATSTSTGTMNVNSGGIVNSEHDLIVGFAGNSSTQGTLNVNAGGTVNIGSVTERWLIVNQFDDANGTVNVNEGGTLNLIAGTDIATHTGNTAALGNAVINVDGGQILGTGAANVDASSIKLHGSNGAGSATVTIQHGGVVQVQSVLVAIAGTGTSIVNFDNGTLRALGDETDLIALSGSDTHAINILAGGAIIDSNGFTVGINEEMTGAGGLSKIGAGTLTLTGMNTYMGDTSIYDGTLSINTAYLADGANVGLITGSIFDLNFVGTDTVFALIIDGVPQATGTWGALGSGADHESDLFTGTGLLMVTSAVPEPGTLMLVLGGGASMLLLARRRNRRG